MLHFKGSKHIYDRPILLLLIVFPHIHPLHLFHFLPNPQNSISTHPHPPPPTPHTPLTAFPSPSTPHPSITTPPPPPPPLYRISTEHGGPLLVRHVSYAEGRGNIIVEYPGREEGKVVSFVGCHLDVVTANPQDWVSPARTKRTPRKKP